VKKFLDAWFKVYNTQHFSSQAHLEPRCFAPRRCEMKGWFGGGKKQPEPAGFDPEEAGAGGVESEKSFDPDGDGAGAA
jgi:hypothetical protein